MEQMLRRKFRKEIEARAEEIERLNHHIDEMTKRAETAEKEADAQRDRADWAERESAKLKKTARKAAEERDLYLSKYKDTKAELESDRYARDIHGPSTEAELREIGLTLSEPQFNTFLTKRCSELKSIVDAYQKKTTELEKSYASVLKLRRRDDETIETLRKAQVQLKSRLKEMKTRLKEAKLEKTFSETSVQTEQFSLLQSAMDKENNFFLSRNAEEEKVVEPMVGDDRVAALRGIGGPFLSRTQAERNEKRKRLALDLGTSSLRTPEAVGDAQAKSAIRWGSNGMGGTHKVISSLSPTASASLSQAKSIYSVESTCGISKGTQGGSDKAKQVQTTVKRRKPAEKSIVAFFTNH